VEIEDLPVVIIFFSLNYQERNGKQTATNYIIKLCKSNAFKNK